MERIINQFPSLLALLAGSLVPLAFAPVQLYPLVVLALAMLYLVWCHASPRQAFWRGWCFGVGFFTVGTYWIFHSIHIYGPAPIWLAAILTGVFIAVLALYPALNGWVLLKLFPVDSRVRTLLAFPALWVLFEWVRAWFLTGFPWLLLGFSQVHSPLANLAPVIGTFGLSLLIVFSSGLLALLYQYGKRSGRNWKRLLLTLITLALIWGAASLFPNHWTHLADKPLVVSLVQGDIAQSVKWDREEIPKTIRKYMQLTQPYWSSDIIVWPEGAIPVPAEYAGDLLQELNKMATFNEASFITGIPLLPKKSTYYNGIIALGAASGRYAKRNLVPFGEYVPLEKWLRGLIKFFDLPMSNMQSGAALQPPLTAGAIKIAPLICYEVAYSKTVRSMLPTANLLLTISDDTWFGDSFAPAQHLQMSQMRSLETGRYQMVATNDGITALLDSHGKILKRAPQFTPTVLRGRVYAATGTTPWIQYGDAPVFILCFILLIIAKGYFLVKNKLISRTKNVAAIRG